MIVLFCLPILALYVWVLVGRGRASRKFESFCGQLIQDLAGMSGNFTDPGAKDRVLGFLKKKCGGLHDNPGHGKAGLLSRLGLSIEGSLQERVCGRLETAMAALTNACRPGESPDLWPRREALTQDLFFLFLLLGPLAWLPFGVFGMPALNTVFWAAVLLAVLVIWIGLRLWNGGSDRPLIRVDHYLDAVCAYALRPIEDSAQREAANALIARLNEACIAVGNEVGSLQKAIAATPAKMAEKVEARLTERTTLTDSLKALGKQGQAMEKAIAGHAAVIQAIPQRLAQTVAAEVAGGLDPTRRSVEALKDDLTKSYGQMSRALEHTAVQLVQAIRCFSDGELLRDWLQRVQESNATIGELGVRMDRHFDNAETAAHALHKVAGSVMQLQQQVGDELKELNRLNAFRGVDEKLWAEKVLGVFRANLEKIESEHRAFRGIIDSFIQKVDQDAAIREALRNELPNVMSELREVSTAMKTTVEKAESMPELHADILKKIEKNAAESETNLYRILNRMSEEFQSQYRDFHEKVVAATAKTVGKLAQMAEAQDRSAAKRVQELTQREDAFVRNLAEQSAAAREALAAQFAKAGEALTEQGRVSLVGYQNFLRQMEVSTRAHAEQEVKNLAAMNDGLIKLAEQAKAWEAVVQGLDKSQQQRGVQLANHLSKTVAAGMNQVVAKIDAQVEALAAGNRRHEAEIGNLLVAAQEQAKALKDLTRDLGEQVKGFRKPTPVQIAHVVLMTGIFGLILSSMMNWIG